MCVSYSAQVLGSVATLNKAPNNKDVMWIVNIMLNEASNSNDVTHVVNVVCLTTTGAPQFSMGGYIVIMQKSRLTREEK